MWLSRGVYHVSRDLSIHSESVGVGMIGSSRTPLSPTAGRLHKEGEYTCTLVYMYACTPLCFALVDMAIYGQEPATDKMLLVVCNVCGRVLKLQAVVKHNGESGCGLSEVVDCDSVRVI